MIALPKWIVGVLAFASVVAYWPGGTNRYASAPTYPHRIEVRDEFPGGARWHRNLRRALHGWNRCGADVRLVLGDRGDIVTTYDNAGPWGTPGQVAFPRNDIGYRVIEHELGHALGFGHGGTGVMGPGDAFGREEDIDALDCRGLRAYYGRAA